MVEMLLPQQAQRVSQSSETYASVKPQTLLTIIHSEHHQHENAPSGTTSAADSSTKDASLLPGPAPNTAGPHKKDWMNKYG
jgi:hypothetical protein